MKRPWLLRPVVRDKGIAQYPLYWVVILLLIVWIVIALVNTNWS